LPRRSGSRLLALVAAATLAVAASAAKPPDWVVEASHRTLPTLPSDTAAVVLYSEQQTSVGGNGEIEIRYRMAYKILRDSGRKYGEVIVLATKDTPLVSLKGWSLAPDGTSNEAKQKDAVETDLNPDTLYSDDHMYVLDLPAAVPGNVVAYEYVQKGRPDIAEDEWWFQQPVPVLDARYALSIPDSWKFSAFWANHAAEDPQDAGANEHVWELRDIPAVDVEDDMPPWRAVAGRMVVKYASPEKVAQVEQAGSWHDMGLWYAGISDGRRDPTPAIRQQAAALTANRPQPLDKIRAIAAYVQHNVRYVAIEIGIGGYQPHAAGQIFTNQYGDCKDKATLLSSMLSAIGVKSYYAIAESQRGIVRQDLPSLESFDHMILAIQLPPDASDKDLYSVVNDPTLGKLLFFDPTDDYTPLGDLPAPLQDNSVLLVKPDGGELVHLPLLPSAVNRLVRTATFTLGPDGNLTGKVEEVSWGEPAAERRAEFLDAVPADRAKILNRFLGAFLDRFDLLSATLGNLNQFNEDFIVNYSFVAHNYARSAGNLILLRPAVLGRKEPISASTKPRKYPVEFPATEVDTDVFQITLPAGYVVDELPPPTSVDSGPITYRSSITAKGNVIEYKRTYSISQVLVPSAQVPALRAAAEKIVEDEHASIILRQAAN
jgi:transglutaminase-like putative cysteine protease